MKIGLMTAAATAVFALSTTVFAQGSGPATKAGPASAPSPTPSSTTITTSDYTESHVEGNQIVTFPGDPLPGDQNSAYGFTLRRPPGVLRAGLIRPRVNFVPELLKSVENL